MNLQRFVVQWPKRQGKTCGLALFALFTVCACSTTNPPATAQTAQSGRVCTVEKPLGSQIPKRVCRSRAQVEAEKSSAASIYREQIRRTGPIGSPEQ